MIIESVLDELVAAQRASGIRVRALAVPCNFAGSGAYRLGFGPEVLGERFWEHLSRLRKALREQEVTLPKEDAILAIATERLIRQISIPRGCKWSHQRLLDIKTEIELLSTNTRVKLGTLHW